jgi:putative flavoprotein involved in K+ transport
MHALKVESAFPANTAERIKVVVIGGGQAGLSVGYHLASLNIPFTILNADRQIGDSWRNRWDSLRLFTPARYDGLDGMPFPARPRTYPTKDEMANYLADYAWRFGLPVRNEVRVERLSRVGDRYLVSAGDLHFEAEHVVVAMANYQKPVAPPFAADLDPDIVQLHSGEYRNSSQLKAGGVLVVGAGNSGAEIALEVTRDHRTWISGRDVGQIPFRIDGVLGRYLLSHLVLRLVFHRVLTLSTPIGRRLRPKLLHRTAPLIRTKRRDLAAAGVEWLPRTTGVDRGRPVVADGRVLDSVANVIWCTGFESAFSWIQLPIFDADGEPLHSRGVVGKEPGLYFVGRNFLYAMSSTMVQGVSRDAAHVASTISARLRAATAKEGLRLGCSSSIAVAPMRS